VISSTVAVMLDGYDHNAPPEVLTQLLTGFFGGHR
jgi:hypothetical protein